MSRSAAAVVLDTDVFSLLYVHRRSSDSRIDRWRELLRGRAVLISFQTQAELLAGAVSAKWGTQRMDGLRGLLARTPTVGIDSSVIDAYAALHASCRVAGHPLQDKVHTGDRWIAACAIGKGVELLAGDGIYAGAPGVSLLV